MTRGFVEDHHLGSAWRWETARANYLARLGREEQAAAAQELAGVYRHRLEAAGIGLEVQP